MLSVIMLSVIMLSVNMLSVIMLSVIMLSVVAPFFPSNSAKGFFVSLSFTFKAFFYFEKLINRLKGIDHKTFHSELY